MYSRHRQHHPRYRLQWLPSWLPRWGAALGQAIETGFYPGHKISLCSSRRGKLYPECQRQPNIGQRGKNVSLWLHLPMSCTWPPRPCDTAQRPLQRCYISIIQLQMQWRPITTCLMDDALEKVTGLAYLCPLPTSTCHLLMILRTIWPELKCKDVAHAQ